MPTHKRIRMFNTRDTYPNQTLDNDLCQAVVAGNTVYLRGQIGTDFDGNLVGLGESPMHLYGVDTDLLVTRAGLLGLTEADIEKRLPRLRGGR